MVTKKSPQIDLLMRLPNVGFVMAKHLIEIDIHSPEELRAAGYERVFLLRQAVDPGACIHELYAIAGAIKGIPSNEFTTEEKAELKFFFSQAKKNLK